MNGHFFSNLNVVNGNSCENGNEMVSNDDEKHDHEKNMVLTNEQVLQLEDQRQELADLRRQVVFLQVRNANLNSLFLLVIILLKVDD